MGLVSKIKKRQENKKKEKVKWTNVEAFKITEIEQSPALEAAEGVETCWKRSVEKITKQLGKDLPRFSNKIVFCTSEDYKLIENHFQENMNHIEPILSNSLLHSIPPDLFLSSEDLESLSHSESNIYKLKTTLLLFAFFFEGGYHSQAYQYILSNFDENLGNAKDLAFACEVFLEKTFIPEERENIDLEFPTKSKALNVLRGVTQGHFSSVATGFQSRLGMKNITSNVHHVIYIILPDDEGCTTVLHYKIESGGWGNIRWLLSVKLDNDYNNLIEIEFNIDTLIFNDGTTDEKKEDIITALKPFFSPNLCNIFGLPMDFTLRGLNESMLKRWIDQMQNIECKDLILDINLIDEIRYSFGHLSNTLISLSIAKNGLRNIPQSILELKNLEYLNLGLNRISEVPDNIDNLTKLEELILSNNRIVSLPLTIGNLKYLKSLGLASNRITFIPQEIKLLKLETLKIHNNPISVPLGIDSILSSKISIDGFYNKLFQD